MATVSRAVANGTGLGAASGAVTGMVIAAIQLIDSAETQLAAGLVIYGAIGGVVGVTAGALLGATLGLLLGLALNLLLGPADQVPRRSEQLPLARKVGAAVGLLPLLMLSRLDEWWPLAVTVSGLAAVVIAMRVPKIAGITSLSARSPKPQRSSR